MRKIGSVLFVTTLALLTMTLLASALVISVTVTPQSQTQCAGAVAHWDDDVFFINPPQDISLTVDYGDGTSQTFTSQNQVGPDVFFPVDHVFSSTGTFFQRHSAWDPQTSPPKFADSTVSVPCF